MKKCVCGEEMTPAEWKNQWVCHRCGRTKPMSTTVTNADRIRSMSDEELAKWLNETDGLFTCGDCIQFNNHPCDNDCKKHCLEWLQQPAEEDGNAKTD